MSDAQIACRHFNGYKPCGKNEVCDELCPSRDIPKKRIVLVHLGALGAVLRSTALLPAIKRKYPSSHITWLTQKPAHSLLENLNQVDKVMTTDLESLKILETLQFDVALIVDKSQFAGSIAYKLNAKEKYGFLLDPSTGSIVPANDEAKPLWDLGLDNHKKFFENKKPETQLVAESLSLSFMRDPYQVSFNLQEQEMLRLRENQWRSHKSKLIVGINTGCSDVIPYKKLSLGAHIELIRMLQKEEVFDLVLLGGPEDRERNDYIQKITSVASSPCDQGLRDGLCSVAACDIVISGDSLGMHMAIALQKYVVAWFGPTCAHEIDLYDRGVKIQSPASCAPCWKRHCAKEVMCYDLVPLDEILQALRDFSGKSLYIEQDHSL